MKSTLLLVVALFSGVALWAQEDSRYTQYMTQTVALLDTARAGATFARASNTFERIAANAPNEWLPAYYHAYCQMMLALDKMESGKPEECGAHLEKAQESLTSAAALSANNSEILALQAYVYQGRLWGDPMTNGPIYAPKAQQVLQEAMRIDPANPRPHYLMGQQLLFTPEFYGGGGKAALPWLEKAEALFESAQPASALHPRWGKGANAYMLSRARS